MGRITGVITALPTPMDRSGQLMAGALERHVNDQIRAGAAGFWVNGGTGGSVYLSLDQRKQQLQRVIDVVSGRALVLAMVSAMSLVDSLELARHAGAAGADGVSALPPLVYPSAAGNCLDFLKAIRDAADLPITYYHVPGLTHVDLDAEQLAHLCENVPLEAVKFSDPDIYKAALLAARCPDVSLLTGFEPVLAAGLAVNCFHGTAGASQNFMTGPYVQIVNAHQQHNFDRAARITAGVLRVTAIQGMFDFTAATYGFVNLLGYEYGQPPAPMARLSDQQQETLKQQLLKVIKPDPIEQGRLIETRDLLHVPCQST